MLLLREWVVLEIVTKSRRPFSPFCWFISCIWPSLTDHSLKWMMSVPPLHDREADFQTTPWKVHFCPHFQVRVQTVNSIELLFSGCYASLYSHIQTTLVTSGSALQAHQNSSLLHDYLHQQSLCKLILMLWPQLYTEHDVHCKLMLRYLKLSVTFLFHSNNNVREAGAPIYMPKSPRQCP